MSSNVKRWQLDETSRLFIHEKLAENHDKILAFRDRWKITDDCPGSPDGLPNWKKIIERECQHLRRKIRVSEMEVYFVIPYGELEQPVLSSDLEGRLREEDRGNSLEAAFELEVRAFGAELKFPSAWDRVLEYYLLFNNENFELVYNHGITISVRYRINKEYGLIGENVCLTLDENTASPDLENFWIEQVKHLLDNLPARVKGHTRRGKNVYIFEELLEREAMKPGWQETEKNEETGEVIKDTDVDIAIARLSDEEADRVSSFQTPEQEKQIRKTLGKKVRNARYQWNKKHPVR
ncbi:MAG: hypothetical protein NTX52_14230 [Planctomycetota bacterium]|nr:hypothetical protein [Planctomycetota bacterium]